MRIILSILFILLSISTFAETIEEAIKVLEKKDYSIFKGFIVKRKSISPCSEPGELRIRQFLAGYREVIAPILIFEPTPGGLHEGKCHFYEIHLLGYGNRIIKYAVYSKEYGESDIKNYVLLKEYSDQNDVANFEERYQQKYFRKINLKELFDKSSVYGDYCGIAGINPGQRALLKGYITSKNVTELFNWLTSPNYEKKLYAYEGYKALIKNGYVTNAKEQVIIDDLKNLKGPVATCSGCMFWNDGFEGILNRINDYEFTMNTSKIESSITDNTDKTTEDNAAASRSENPLLILALIGTIILLGIGLGYTLNRV